MTTPSQSEGLITGDMMATLLGAAFAIFVLQTFWEFALFRRVFNDPLAGKLTSVIVAWLTAGTIAGFGMADGGPYAWQAFGIYALGAVPIGLWAVHRGLKLRREIEEAEPDPATADIFS